VHTLSQQATAEYEGARETLREFINAPSERNVIFVRGVTEALNLVAQSFGQAFVRAGDEILVSAMEHHSNIVPWQMLAERSGAKVVVIPMRSTGELDMDAYAKQLNPKVKLVAVNHIANALGTINPVEEMIALAHAQDIPVLVDGAQSAPHMHVDVQKLDCDFYTFSGHKMFGPTGIGLLYGKERWLEAMPPFHGGGDMIETVSFNGSTYAGLPAKFEAGTPHIAGAIGMAEATRFLMRYGYEAIQAHEDRLLDRALKGLQSIPQIKLVGKPQHRASLVTFVVEGLHSQDVATLLDQQGIAVRVGHHCAQPVLEHFKVPSTIRASFAFYNTEAEVDRLVEGLKKAIELLG